MIYCIFCTRNRKRRRESRDLKTISAWPNLKVHLNIQNILILVPLHFHMDINSELFPKTVSPVQNTWPHCTPNTQSQNPQSILLWRIQNFLSSGLLYFEKLCLKNLCLSCRRQYHNLAINQSYSKEVSTHSRRSECNHANQKF